jgi:hypothetical protein
MSLTKGPRPQHMECEGDGSNNSDTSGSPHLSAGVRMFPLKCVFDEVENMKKA